MKPSRSVPEMGDPGVISLRHGLRPDTRLLRVGRAESGPVSGVGGSGVGEAPVPFTPRLRTRSGQ